MIPGVLYFVSSGKEPVAISSSEIDAVRSVMNSGYQIKPSRSVEAGQAVVLTAGPFKGVREFYFDTSRVIG
jgi:transcription antitermination factor NusG